MSAQNTRTRSAIGLLCETSAAAIWYASDTNLTNELFDQVSAISPTLAMVIAHANVSNID